MRTILDTMVWSYISDRGEQFALETLEDRRKLELVIPPSVLLETLRTPRPEVRSRIVTAICSRPGKRIHPPSEAKREADELVAAVRKHRPAWLRAFPRDDKLPALEAFWTRKLWQDAKRNPQRVADIAITYTNSEQEAEAALQRQRTLKNSLGGGQAPGAASWFADISDQPDQIKRGWNGERIEAWRFENAVYWWTHLCEPGRRSDTTPLDWAGPWLKINMIRRDRPGWNCFWYHEVAPAELPRNWIRTTLPWAQLATKIGPGNPRDAQHAAYLFDADIFITADRRFARVLDLLRSETPAKFAEVRIIPGDAPIIHVIEEIVPTTR
jgi:hypothetical protein